MPYYKEDNNRKGKIWGGVWVLLYLALWIVLILVVRFNIRDISKPDEGIMINFGDVESAAGAQDTDMTDHVAQTASPEPVEVEQTPPDDHGDVEIERPKTQPKPKPTQSQPVEQPRQVDQRALFPGRTAASASTSEGTTAGQGNQGNPAGTPDGSHDGTGTGTSGVNFSLEGRNPVGSLPKPAYNSRREGRVVVYIKVDEQGNVIDASYQAIGSAGVDNTMIEDALRAARKAKFTTAQAEVQAGTITYTFRMQ